MVEKPAGSRQTSKVTLKPGKRAAETESADNVGNSDSEPVKLTTRRGRGRPKGSKDTVPGGRKRRKKLEVLEARKTAKQAQQKSDSHFVEQVANLLADSGYSVSDIFNTQADVFFEDGEEYVECQL